MPSTIRTQCCSCRKMKQPDGTWKHEKRFDANTPGLSHGICPPCKDTTLAMFRRRSIERGNYNV